MKLVKASQWSTSIHAEPNWFESVKSVKTLIKQLLLQQASEQQTSWLDWQNQFDSVGWSHASPGVYEIIKPYKWLKLSTPSTDAGFRPTVLVDFLPTLSWDTLHRERHWVHKCAALMKLKRESSPSGDESMNNKNWSHHLSNMPLCGAIPAIFCSNFHIFPRFGQCRSGGHEILCATTNICTAQLWRPILTNQVASKDSSHPWKNKKPRT